MAQTIEGTASFDGPKNVAKLGVTFQNMMGKYHCICLWNNTALLRFTFTAFKGTYWVLGTDYDNYSVVWSCTPLGFLNFRKYL